MTRYIDAEKFKQQLEIAMKKMHLIGGVKGVDVGAVINALDMQPTADVVPVVRCKYCQNCEVIYPVKIIGQEPEEVYYCKAHNGSRNPNDFCSYGRRKDEISKATDS